MDEYLALFFLTEPIWIIRRPPVSSFAQSSPWHGVCRLLEEANVQFRP
jgi:hypothetical protein